MTKKEVLFQVPLIFLSFNLDFAKNSPEFFLQINFCVAKKTVKNRQND